MTCGNIHTIHKRLTCVWIYEAGKGMTEIYKSEGRLPSGINAFFMFLASVFLFFCRIKLVRLLEFVLFCISTYHYLRKNEI